MSMVKALHGRSLKLRMVLSAAPITLPPMITSGVGSSPMSATIRHRHGDRPRHRLSCATFLNLDDVEFFTPDHLTSQLFERYIAALGQGSQLAVQINASALLNQHLSKDVIDRCMVCADQFTDLQRFVGSERSNLLTGLNGRGQETATPIHASNALWESGHGRTP